jgi:hypothetical protein
MRHCNAKNKMYSSWFDDWATGFSEFYAQKLMKAFSYKPGFIASYGSIKRPCGIFVLGKEERETMLNF